MNVMDFSITDCKVCGEAAADGRHYAVLTCASCSVFFKRHSEKHKNSGIKNCDILTCHECRYAKCVEVGMKLEGMRRGRMSDSLKRRKQQKEDVTGDESREDSEMNWHRLGYISQQQH